MVKLGRIRRNKLIIGRVRRMFFYICRIRRMFCRARRIFLSFCLKIFIAWLKNTTIYYNIGSFIA